MISVLFDTNILIDHYAGHAAATDEIAYYSDAAISAISWLEVACRMSRSEEIRFQQWLNQLEIRVIQTTVSIIRTAATIRGASFVLPPKIKLADAIIGGTAWASGRLLITRNPRDFGGESAKVRVPYDIVNGVAVNIRPPAG
ncbi:PIN domain-containing protein [Oxalobacteraceae bacterium A2-2]